MAEIKEKKIRVAKYAAEINLSAEQLIDFLSKKGFEIKSINSPLTDVMITEINNHYKKDIEKTEKHNKKIAEINKKRFDDKKVPKELVVEVKAEPDAAIEIPVLTEVEAEPVEAQTFPDNEVKEETQEVIAEPLDKSVQPAEEVKTPLETPVREVTGEPEIKVEEKPESEIVSEKPVEAVKEIAAVEAEEIKSEPITQVKIEDKTIKETIPVKVEETKLFDEGPEVIAEPEAKPFKPFISPKDLEASKRKGLNVIGKMDLEEKKKKPLHRKDDHHFGDKKGEKRFEKKKFPDDKRPEDRKPEVKKPTDKKQFDVVQTAAQESELKKKKKPKTKKKVETVAGPEESPIVKKRKKIKKFEVDQKDVKEAIRKTMLAMDDSGVQDRAKLRQKKRKEREEKEEKIAEQKQMDSNKIAVTEFIAVNELANLMSVSVSEVISKCIQLGIMVSINQRLDVETITLVADEFGFEVEFQKEYTAEALEDTPDDPESLIFRSPVVTIMGHVDHGKTSLLDYIRNANVVAGESGGITQHIGAYRVDVGNGKTITFLDTPGHEAFTAMRARGANLTDIVVLVVAADDAVMPQTVEAINHAQAANVPIVIAVNKIDKPGANIDKIKQQLAERNILVEDWGGKYQCVQISAKTGLNVDVLLEKILLESEMLDLKANPNRSARGAVVESELDKGRGITGTILVQKGTLKVGDPFVAGIHFGKVRAMFDERNVKVFEAPPSTPVLVLGFEGAPQAGDTFVALESERQAREISIKRQQLKREQDQKQIHHVTLDEIAQQISIGGVKELPLIVKGDVDGSVEAISDSLMKLSNQEVIVRVIHKGVGGISESDILLAAASNAIVVGFHVRPNLNARKLAENQKVDIRLYNVIYDIINEVKSALEGLLSPVISEEVVATLEIRNTFRVPKFGNVAGCQVLDGKITRNSKVRLVRDGIVIHEGEIATLKRFKEDVREVDAGYECGLNLANFNDIKIGDIIEAYKIVETKKKLV
ncbi:MAG: translation initiation factor IF-2 [Bacteroidota bacterium]|nr:translation initiation factor IF-2 [Bacteroidota bacterium]